MPEEIMPLLVKSRMDSLNLEEQRLVKQLEECDALMTNLKMALSNNAAQKNLLEQHNLEWQDYIHKLLGERVEPAAAEARAFEPTMQDRIKRAALAGPVHIKTICEELGITRQHANGTLSRLVRAGVIGRIAPGFYAPPTKP